MKYEIVSSARFKKDLKLAIKRGYNMNLIETVVNTLASGNVLEAKHKDHALSGEFIGCRECHITPDWLLIYEIDKGQLLLYLTRTGTHSDLF